jgi:hypothetical protein
LYVPRLTSAPVALLRHVFDTRRVCVAWLARLQVYGRNWEQLQAALPSKSLTQIKGYYHNYKV